jgi:hypothetical protein
MLDRGLRTSGRAGKRTRESNRFWSLASHPDPGGWARSRGGQRDPAVIEATGVPIG